SYASLAGFHSQSGNGAHGWKPMGGWRFGNTIDGCQAEYVRVPDAMANLAPVPDDLTDEEVLMCPDIMSTGFAGAEHGDIRISSYASLAGFHSQSGNGAHGWKPMGGWRFGNTIDGCQAEYVRVPDAMANLAPVPDDLTDEEVLMCPDIMSTGFAGAEHGDIRIGDTVAVFAQGPIGLCATAGARLRGATQIIAVDAVPERMEMSKRLGADHVIDFKNANPVDEILRLTDGRGVDVAIEALGTQQTFESCLRVLRPGGVLSSLGVYSSDLHIPLGPFAAGLGDHKIVTSLCPGGKERMRRLLGVVASRRLDFRPLVTHRFKLDEIESAYELFANQRDGVMKVAITP